MEHDWRKDSFGLARGRARCVNGSIAGALFVAAIIAGSSRWERGVAQEEAGKPPRTGNRLAEEQAEIREVIVELRSKMQEISRQIAESEPEEAKRIREAAEAISSDDLPRQLAGVRDLLSRGVFLDALVKQEGAIESLDRIIALLEARRFRPEDAGAQQEALRRRIAAVRQLASDQASLLEKTKSWVGDRSALESMRDLARWLDALRKRQEALHGAASSREVDPESTRQDEGRLARALRFAEGLLGEQGRVDRELAGLGSEKAATAGASGSAQSATDPRERLQRRLEEAVRRARELLEGSRELAGGTRPSSGEPAGDQKPSGSEAGSGEKPSGSEAGSGEKPSGSEAGSGEKPSGSQSGNPAGESSAGAREPSPSARGERAAEPAKRAGELARAARRLELDLAGLGREEGARSVSGAPSELEAARRQAGRAAEALEGGRPSEATTAAEDLLGRLERLRKGLGAERAGGRPSSAAARQARAAGLRQEEARLGREAAVGSEQMESEAGEATDEAAGGALGAAAEALRRAGARMAKAAKALGGGQRNEARQAGREASDELRGAKRALEDGKRALAGRTEAERRRQLQRKLARDAGRAADAARRLEKKLGRKKPPDASGESSLERALRAAAQAMEGAAEASRQGQEASARARRQEALERLERARTALQGEEKDRLERLRRKRPDEGAGAQKDLAERTGRLSRQPSPSGDSGGRSRPRDLEGASGNMQKAAEALRRDRPDDAVPDQEKALEKLRKSEREMRQEEDRLAELEREREMTSMIEEITALRAGEESIRQRTLEIHASRADRRESRRELLRLRRKIAPLVEEQEALVEKIAGLSERLDREGARVFGFMLENVSSDMKQVGELLGDTETGDYTQFLEKQVVGDLDRLLAALEERRELARRRKEEPKPPSGSGSGGQGASAQEPLVSLTEELLMLRQLQRAVNRQTERLEDLQRAGAKGAKGTDAWNRALQRLAQRQGSISRLTGQVVEEFRKARQAQREAEAGEGKAGEAGGDEGEEPDEPDGGGEPSPEEPGGAEIAPGQAEGGGSGR